MLAIDDGGHRHEDRREEHEEAPEDERVHQAGNQPLQQLSLAEHDGRLVAYPDGDLGSAIRRLARADEPREQEGAACEERACDRDRDYECDRGGDARGRAQPGPAF